ncbi:MAG: hypothetical protein IPK64_00325 [bacterium]|nr:hypothetical protein [bacterium]
MLLENALLLYPMFDSGLSSDTATWLIAGGVLLKAVDTVFTLKAVNDYNENLAIDMGIIAGPTTSTRIDSAARTRLRTVARWAPKRVSGDIGTWQRVYGARSPSGFGSAPTSV